MLLNKFISFNYYIKLHLILVWLIVPALSSELPQAFPLLNQDPVVRSPINSINPGFFFFFSKALSRLIFCIYLLTPHPIIT